MFYVDWKAIIPWALAFCLHHAIFRFYMKNVILFLIKTFEPNCVEKSYVYIIWVFFFFLTPTIAPFNVKSLVSWIKIDP